MKYFLRLVPTKNPFFFSAQFSNFLKLRITECSVWSSQQVNHVCLLQRFPYNVRRHLCQCTDDIKNPLSLRLDKVSNHTIVSFYRRSSFKYCLGNIVTNLQQADNFGNLHDRYYML
jgi:hypothetical protein